MILPDTSIWIDHFRHRNATLSALLENNEALHHPFIEGELVMGSLRPTHPIFPILRDMPKALVASHDEVFTLVARYSLSGRGIGWVDVHLLASTLLTDNARLWTRDQSLHDVAHELGIAA